MEFFKTKMSMLLADLTIIYINCSVSIFQG
jgi:hypothetical protein